MNLLKIGRYEDKDFHLAVGRGLGWVKWLKNGEGQGFVFRTIILAEYLFDENFIGLVKEPLY